MPDIFDTLKKAFDLTKQLIELADAAKNAHAKMVTADLQVQLAELKVRLAGLLDENTQLKTDLKKAQSTEPEVVLKEGLYYHANGDGPFCTLCYDSNHKLIRVAKLTHTMTILGKWRCGICKTHYN